MLSVVIPTYNRSESLSNCLKAIFQNSIQPNQIIIIDASEFEGGLQSFKSSPQIVYKKTQIKSAAVQRNIGMNEVISTCKYLAFLDDDVLIPTNYFEELIKTMNETSCIGVSGVAVNPRTISTDLRQNPLIRLISRIFFLDSNQSGVVLYSGVNIPVKENIALITKVDWLIGCSIWNFDTINHLKFENDFFGQSLGEDVIFSMKASKLGPLCVNRGVIINHLESKIMRPNAEVFMYMWIRNRYRIIQSLPSIPLHGLAFHWANFGKFLQIVFLVKRDKIKALRGFFHGYVSLRKNRNEN